MGAENIFFVNFSSPLSGCHARRGLLGAGNLTFLILQALPATVLVLEGGDQGDQDGGFSQSWKAGGARPQDSDLY